MKEMKIDHNRVKKWREERLWSQDHLASVAGVSLRTVQRLETGGGVSRETIMAIAAAFEVGVDTFSVSHNQDEHQQRRRQAAQLVLSFWIHAATYIFVIGLLLAINFAERPNEFWSLWIVIGWGIGVAAHGLTAFITHKASASDGV